MSEKRIYVFERAAVFREVYEVEARNVIGALELLKDDPDRFYKRTDDRGDSIVQVEDIPVGFFKVAEIRFVEEEN